ncbi:hypothetical protein EJB05_26569, partial [Eragrostis curvula]
MASSVSGSDIPMTTTEDAPRNWPVESCATAAYEAFPVFFDVSASTLIFMRPDGGGYIEGSATTTNLKPQVKDEWLPRQLMDGLDGVAVEGMDQG